MSLYVNSSGNNILPPLETKGALIPTLKTYLFFYNLKAQCSYKVIDKRIEIK